MNCLNCSRVNHINGIKDNKCYFCNAKLSIPSLKQYQTSGSRVSGSGVPVPNLVQKVNVQPSGLPSHILRAQRPVSSPPVPSTATIVNDERKYLNPIIKAESLNTSKQNPRGDPITQSRFLRAGNDIIVNNSSKEIEILKGSPVSNAQQIEKNRGNISVNRNQQAFLTLKNKNFIETEYGSSTDVFGNYAPDEDEYETSSVDKNYNYKKSADELMKERGDY